MGRKMGRRFKREVTYVYLWLIHVAFGRKQQNSVKQLSFNFKIGKKRKYKEQDSLEEKEYRKFYSSGYKELLQTCKN